MCKTVKPEPSELKAVKPDVQEISESMARVREFIELNDALVGATGHLALP